MSINDLPVLSALRTKMQWHQERQRVLSENVSNSDTPNFKPRDLVAPQFDKNGASSSVGGTTGALAMMRTSSSHLAVSGGAQSFEGDGGRSGFLTRPAEPVQIASISTLDARAVRSSSLQLPPADLVIVDEAHHTPARTWRRLIGAYPEAVVLGLTATPCRGDGRGLGDIFETMIECASIPALISGSYLVPARVYASTQPDLHGVRVRGGDYVEAELARENTAGRASGIERMCR